MKTLKNLLLITTITIILLCIASFTASAETHSGTCGENLNWTLYENGLLEILGTGKMLNWEHISYTPWYDSMSNITTVILADGITNIGDNAFSFCENLTQVTMSDSIISIGNYSFYSCDSLTDLSLSNNIEIIGEGAFSCCSSLINIDIADKENLKTIEKDAFADCSSLVNIVIPNNVLLIGEKAFLGCYNVTEVIIGNKVENIGASAFSSCENLTKITIPASVKTIGDYAFYYSFQISEVNYLGDLAGWFSINFVGDYSTPKMESGTKLYFNGKPLEGNITIPDNVTIIPRCFFADCVDITGITFSKSVQSISAGAFSCCDNLESIIFDVNSQLKGIGDGAFESCNSLKSVIIPDGCQVIGAGAFASCNQLEKVVIPNSVTTIGKMAFVSPSLKIIEVDNNNQHFSSSQDGILFNKDKTILVQYPSKRIEESYEVPNSVIEIKGYAFAFTENIKHIIMANGIEQIGVAAFGACNKLEYVHIPSSVIEIGEMIIVETPAYICSDTEDCYAKKYAEANGYEFRLCEGHTHTHEHTYTAEITQVATATQNCVITYTCSCGDSYTAESFANGFDLSSTGKVDFDNNFIFGLSAGVDSLEAYTTIVAKGFEWVYELTDNGFGTGTVAKLTDGETVLSEYTILIFGDADGDGWYDGNDAFIVNLIINGMLDKEDVSEALWVAADCNHDGVIDEADVDLLTGAGLLLNNVDQSATQSELETNSFYIEYMGLIDQSVEIDTEVNTDVTAVEDNVGNGLDRSEKENNFEIIIANIISFIKQILSFVISLLFN